MLRALLGLEPVGDRLSVDPVLPEQTSRLALRRLPGRWHRAEAVAGTV
jgi:cellobiose phosphorylase